MIIVILQVWNLKTCPTCTDDQRNKSMIFLEHMIPVLRHVRSKGITPIMWDDMMREWSIDFLKGKLPFFNLICVVQSVIFGLKGCMYLY